MWQLGVNSPHEVCIGPESVLGDTTAATKSNPLFYSCQGRRFSITRPPSAYRTRPPVQSSKNGLQIYPQIFERCHATSIAESHIGVEETVTTHGSEDEFGTRSGMRRAQTMVLKMTLPYWYPGECVMNYWNYSIRRMLLFRPSRITFSISVRL